MSNKTKLIIVIVALAVALVACVFTALILGGVFDKDTGNGEPNNDPISEVADPTGDSADPDTNSSSEPSQSTEPSDPSKPSDPTKPTSNPADVEPGDIKINIDDSDDDPIVPSGGGSSSSGGAASGGAISFEDLLKAAGQK